MNYGFAIDNRRCIGCHACTLACKSEHEMALGNFRTWVKYVDRGVFPYTGRYFAVLRCNHCGDAPCVNICPTRALYHRSDGIVDFDRAHCIGCRACMAACPYDALYMDPETATAAKCNYCAHRIEMGLEPACVTVCPGRAIVAGDLEDDRSEIAALVSREQTIVRKPEKRTAPRVHYVHAEPATLNPAAVSAPAAYMFAERPDWDTSPDSGAIPEGAGRTVYDVPHERPWGFTVSAYLWTKSLATGPLIVAAVIMLAEFVRAPLLFGRAAAGLSLSFTLVTALLLVFDLERPGRFLMVLFRPNWRSWLFWGTHILILFGAVALLWFSAGALGLYGVVLLLVWPGLIMGVLAAGYSAFLFAQARGRDFWQSPVLFPHLVAQSVLAGSALLSLCSVWLGSGKPLSDLLFRWVLAGVCIHGVFVLVEIAVPHGSLDAREAVRLMVHGPLAPLFWLGAVLAGIAGPVYLLAFYILGTPSSPATAVAAALLAALGLAAYDHCFVRAGQGPPLS